MGLAAAFFSEKEKFLRNSRVILSSQSHDVIMLHPPVLVCLQRSGVKGSNLIGLIKHTGLF